MRVCASRDPFVNQRERLLICLRYNTSSVCPAEHQERVDLPSQQSSQASASPGLGDVTVSGNKPVSYPAVLVFLEPSEGDFEGGRCRMGDGLLR